MVLDRHSASEWLRAARSAARQVVVDGMPWLVYELPPAPFDRRSSPSLVFESDNTVRRIRTFPAGWRSLSDEALFALSWSY
jgi:hypothetical protein